MRRFLTASIAALTIWGLSSPAQALLIEMSLESSPGADDFSSNVLGTVSPYSTTLTTAGFYRYGTPNFASYNGELNGGPTPVSSLTQIFLLDATDGLSLVVVHDKANDGSGGRTQTSWNLVGDTGAFVLVDDPGETVIVSAGGTQFDSTKNWSACCTDGYAIGSLDGNWELFGWFRAAPSNIDAWAVVSSSSITIMPLQPGRRLRLTPVAVPEPTSLALFAVGLLSLAFLARRRRKAA